MKDASIYSMKGAIVYQYGDRRVVIERNRFGGDSPLRSYQIRERGEWRTALWPKGIDPLIEKVRAALS